ncbi:MAG: fibronectin type III domain-containing protein [Solirubrobacteraceae bacterium]
MKRTARLMVAAVALATAITGVANAASSPTVATRAATNIGNTSATLQATINPNGNQTSYSFQYGPTSAYGDTTASHSVGHGTKSIAVALGVSGLTPGTTYHYRVVALNASGSASGVDRTFTTTGHPPASVVTGPPVNVTTTTATPTGSVNPEGAATTWVVQYGLTPYLSQTIAGAPLPAVSVSLPVSVPLTGLAPGKLFHYRIVATHGAVVSYGGDQTFFTYPSFRRMPKMSTRTSPSRASRTPYLFTTSGKLYGAAYFVPEPLRCTGVVAIRFYDGSRKVASGVAQVEPNCSFSTQVPFGRLIGHGPTALRVTVAFAGNGYLKPVDRTDHVTLG